MIKHGEKVFLTDLSNFTAFPNAEHLVVMTSTYGQGDAPSNAKRLAERIKQYPKTETFNILL
ncbi:hypothetical protein LWM68_00385 [Niabella sp. W65]|nr:hypothetical protein [Niabella sp. W65]MCH7361377.1 hypothetical protein [Niabella sp. W65]